METTFNLRGKFNISCFDKDGNLKWEKEAKNGATNEGLNKLLDVMFHATTQISTWYIGLITGTGTLAAADTQTLQPKPQRATAGQKTTGMQ